MLDTVPTDTIMAPATAMGGTLAIIRVSGPGSAEALTSLTRKPLPKPRFAQFTQLYHPTSGQLLDEALCIYFKGPNTFTGEDIAEFQLHGGRAVVQAVLAALKEGNPDLRFAEGGEFSKRAYLNGKIDLTKAEAIADLVSAETESQAEIAANQLGGSLRDLYEGWRDQVIRILAYAEAYIDFVDEEDVPPDVFASVKPQLDQLMGNLAHHLDDKALGERLREGFVITIIGAPNAGKSSLLNALAKRDVAIVTAQAGTTRDIIEVPLNLGGLPVILVDTAGLRETSDVIEAEGIRRARARVADADLVLALFDGTQDRDSETSTLIDDKTIIVQTKSDVVKTSDDLAISTVTGDGIDTLLNRITDVLRAQIQRPKGQPLLTRARHRDAVTDALQSLQRCRDGMDYGDTHPIELVIEDLRIAARSLGRLTGRIDVEDLLDVIFRDFCIGK